MDATSAAIVLLFVFTIFSSLGGNKGNISTASSQNYSYLNSSSASEAVVNSSSVDPDYSAGTFSRTSINRHINKFREPGEAIAITDSIMRHSRTYDVNPKLVTALIHRESRFNPWAVSTSGAKGLGQLLPSTAKGLGVDNAFDIDQNIQGTVRYMKYLLSRFDKYSNQVALALASYLEGPNAVAGKMGYTRTTGAYVKDIIEVYNKI
jgi:soluble lytic murein transglycosylase-like protein